MTLADALPSLGEQSLTEPPRIVVDTNAALDWLLFADPATQALGRAVEAGRVVWIGTAAMRDEMAQVLAGGLAVQRGHEPATVLAIWHRHCALQPAPAPAPWRCTDPDDQPFIDLALAAGARWLVSRDKALLKMARRARPLGLSIVTPSRCAPP
jgi:uncharacterized protein